MPLVLLGYVTALWLGILTSISPCPLATNIAAISFIGRQMGNRRQVFLAGFLYMLGRMFTYLVLGMLLVASVTSIPRVSYILQKYMNKVLGPLLILVGMFLLELIQLKFSGAGMSEKMQHQVGRAGVWGAGPLGILFAFSFCPVSAALFFGSLIPLSLKYGSYIMLPSLYGIGTALPVLLFAILIAWGTHLVGKVFSRLTQIEWWFQRVTGVIFILLGIYYSLSYIFGLV